MMNITKNGTGGYSFQTDVIYLFRTHNQSPPTDASSGFLGVIPASPVGAPPPSLPVVQTITVIDRVLIKHRYGLEHSSRNTTDRSY